MQKAEPHDAAAPSGAHKTKANENFFIVPPELRTAENCYESSVRKKREVRAGEKLRAARTGAESPR